jgi:hypothetical protein
VGISISCIFIKHSCPINNERYTDGQNAPLKWLNTRKYDPTLISADGSVSSRMNKETGQVFADRKEKL